MLTCVRAALPYHANGILEAFLESRSGMANNQHKAGFMRCKDYGFMVKNNKIKVFAKQNRHKWHEVILTIALAMVALGTSLTSCFLIRKLKSISVQCYFNMYLDIPNTKISISSSSPPKTGKGSFILSLITQPPSSMSVKKTASLACLTFIASNAFKS